MKNQTQTALEHEVETVEILAVLRHAIDLRYRQFCHAARADWERLIGSDPADACITVRAQVAPAKATRGSGFLKSRKPISKAHVNGSVRFAH